MLRCAIIAHQLSLMDTPSLDLALEFAGDLLDPWRKVARIRAAESLMAPHISAALFNHRWTSSPPSSLRWSIVSNRRAIMGACLEACLSTRCALWKILPTEYRTTYSIQIPFAWRYAYPNPTVLSQRKFSSSSDSILFSAWGDWIMNTNSIQQYAHLII